MGPYAADHGVSSHRPPGVRRVGVKDVAAAAGVSPGTVSNVFNHPQRVRDDKRERVLAAAERMGFVRNESARTLRTGSARTLGLLSLDAWNPFFADIAQGVEAEAAEQGWALLHSYSGRRPERESLYLDLFAQRHVQGVIVVPASASADRLRALRRAGVSTVMLDAHDPGPGAMSVTLDDARGGELALGHLQDRGHRRVAFAGDPDAVPQVRERLAGARRALRGDTSLEVLPVALSMDGGRELADVLVARPAGERPTALFAASDMIAIGVLQTLLRHGIRVPEDLAIVGYDDIEFARQVAIPLTTISQPAHAMGRLAAEMLIGALTGAPPAERHRVFQPELVVRDSTGGIAPT